MKIVQTVLAAIMMAIGAVWILQGANLLAGSAMSGQSHWLYIGIIVALLGAVLLSWTWRRRA
jgi:hypothetical protein